MTHVHAWVAHQRVLGEGRVPLMVETCACGLTRTRKMDTSEESSYLTWRNLATQEGPSFVVR